MKTKQKMARASATLFKKKSLYNYLSSILTPLPISPPSTMFLVPLISKILYNRSTISAAFCNSNKKNFSYFKDLSQSR